MMLFPVKNLLVAGYTSSQRHRWNAQTSKRNSTCILWHSPALRPSRERNPIRGDKLLLRRSGEQENGRKCRSWGAEEDLVLGRRAALCLSGGFNQWPILTICFFTQCLQCILLLPLLFRQNRSCVTLIPHNSSTMHERMTHDQIIESNADLPDNLAGLCTNWAQQASEMNWTSFAVSRTSGALSPRVVQRFPLVASHQRGRADDPGGAFPAWSLHVLPVSVRRLAREASWKAYIENCRSEQTARANGCLSYCLKQINK